MGPPEPEIGCCVSEKKMCVYTYINTSDMTYRLNCSHIPVNKDTDVKFRVLPVVNSIILFIPCIMDNRFDTESTKYCSDFQPASKILYIKIHHIYTTTLKEVSIF
jgi:hypothetical protein